MIDLAKIKYRVTVVPPDGKTYDIMDYIHSLGWEENENELSVRLSFTARNDATLRGRLSKLLKLGSLICIYASAGNTGKEVARGYITEWNPIKRNRAEDIRCICYDELYQLQKSQDNLYLPKGTGTESAITGILKKWKLDAGRYKGPKAVHEKQKFNNEYLSDIILKLLDDAEKKGEKKCLIRASKGQVEILPRGSNQTVYVFRGDNTKQLNISYSTAELVTRVIVTGQEDDDGKRNVRATLNGLTKYGIRQRIYTMNTDETLADAKKAAQEILDEKGSVEKEISVESPDVPFIRKGDKVYLVAGGAKGYYYVKGIRHDIETQSMTMELETAERTSVSENSISTKKDYGVGRVVNFKGGTHYISSSSGAKGSAAAAGKAKITNYNRSGAHPWHLVHEDNTSNIYGWVDDGTFD